MSKQIVGTVKDLKNILEQVRDDAWIRINDDEIEIYKMMNHPTYDKRGYITADNWKSEVIVTIVVEVI